VQRVEQYGHVGVVPPGSLSHTHTRLAIVVAARVVPIFVHNENTRDFVQTRQEDFTRIVARALVVLRSVSGGNNNTGKILFVETRRDGC
jgi:hypothetical protein